MHIMSERDLHVARAAVDPAEPLPCGRGQPARPPVCDVHRASGDPRAPTGDGALSTDADAALVGRIALAAGVALTEVRAAEGAGLEEMFLELSSASQREGVPT